jgi:hypothetical protein
VAVGPLFRRERRIDSDFPNWLATAFAVLCGAFVIRRFSFATSGNADNRRTINITYKIRLDDGPHNMDGLRPLPRMALNGSRRSWATE